MLHKSAQPGPGWSSSGPQACSGGSFWTSGVHGDLPHTSQSPMLGLRVDDTKILPTGETLKHINTLPCFKKSLAATLCAPHNSTHSHRIQNYVAKNRTEQTRCGRGRQQHWWAWPGCTAEAEAWLDTHSNCQTAETTARFSPRGTQGKDQGLGACTSLAGKP